MEKRSLECMCLDIDNMSFLVDGLRFRDRAFLKYMLHHTSPHRGIIGTEAEKVVRITHDRRWDLKMR